MLLRSTTLLCVVAVLTAGTAYGEIAAGDFALGVDASLTHMDGATAVTGSARVSWFAMAQVELVARVAGTVAFGDGADVGMMAFGVDANYLIAMDSAFIPYVGAHILGHELWFDDGAGISGSDLGYGFGGQAGLLYALDEHSHLRVEYRATWLDHGGGSEIQHMGTLGYMYKW